MKIKMSAIHEAVKGYERSKYIINNLEKYKWLELLENNKHNLYCKLWDYIERNNWDSIELITDNSLFEEKRQQIVGERNRLEDLSKELRILKGKNYTLKEIVIGKKRKDRRRMKAVDTQLENLADGDLEYEFMDFMDFTLLRAEYQKQHKEYTKLKDMLEYSINEWDKKNFYWLSCSEIMKDLYMIDINNKLLQLRDMRNNNGKVELKDFNNNVSKLLKFLGWEWHCWNDESGSLRSPMKRDYFSYDWGTREYKYLDNDHYSYGLPATLDEYKKASEQMIFENVILEGAVCYK